MHKATDAFRDLALEKRGCRFSDEIPQQGGDKNSSLFRLYTKKACIFECMLQNVVIKYTHNLRKFKEA